MATQPAASSQTKPNNQTGSTPVQVVPPRKITYVITAPSSKNLSIPYAVAVDGKALPAYANKPSRVSGAKGQITVTVKQGQLVSLYLNSDAHPEFRANPVYQVTAGSRDAIVLIAEKPGKHPETDTPVKQVDADPKKEAAKNADTYVAALTGDIWMKVSHKYTEAEVDALMPAGTKSEVISAIKSIYRGLPSATLTVSVPATGQQAAKLLKITFIDSNNPKDNIVSYSLLKDGLTRVHPGGFAALLTSALEHNIPSLQVTSCWRPMLGSIAHRAGLGLDVGYVGSTRMNRQELRQAFEGKKPTKHGDGDDTDSVSDAEVKKFAEYENAIVEAKASKADLAKAQKALKAAEKTKDPAKIADAQTKFDEAEKASSDAANAESEALDAWNKERNAAEPAAARLFRTSLLKCSCVRQLFDPWVMDENTRDANAPVPNMQRGASTSNERLHAHHLHITVHDPKIL
jgi:hypothetical protein